MLDEVLSRVATQETRHIAFYATQARDRLARSRKARAGHPVCPEGGVAAGRVRAMPQTEVRHLADHLLGDDAGETSRRIDARIDTLPGLAGMHLVEGRVGDILAA